MIIDIRLLEKQIDWSSEKIGDNLSEEEGELKEGLMNLLCEIHRELQTNGVVTLKRGYKK